MSDIVEIVQKGLQATEQKFERKFRELQDEIKDVTQQSSGYRSMPTGGATGGAGAFAGLATKMAQDPVLQAWRDGNRLAGRVSLDMDIKSAMEAKNIIVNNGNEQAPFERMPGIIPQASRRRWLWEFLPLASTTAPAVEYLQETGAVRVAGIQAAEGEEKDESEFTFDLKLANVETFAHFTALSRQVYADAPMLQRFLQQRLMEGVWRKLENQMIRGNGTPPEFRGLTAAGNFTPYVPSTDFTGLDSVRDAIGDLQSADHVASLIILHPADFAVMERERDEEGSFVWANPATAASPMLWGVNVHLSTDMQTGKFIVMDANAAQLWIRQNAQMLISDSHEGNFTKNVLVALCEMRAAFGVLRPEAVIYGDLTNA